MSDTPTVPMTEAVYVTVSGLTGTGKSAVMGEIEIALKALGLTVEHGPEFQAERNGTHADWQTALDLYKPTVVLREQNIARPAPPAPATPEREEVSDATLVRYLRGEAAKNKVKRGEQQHGAHFVRRARKLNQAADRIGALLTDHARLTSRIAELEAERAKDREALEQIGSHEWPRIAGHTEMKTYSHYNDEEFVTRFPVPAETALQAFEAVKAIARARLSDPALSTEGGTE